MKIAVVTGASSGMGKEFVLALDKDEVFDEIWVLARREKRLLELQEHCRAKIRAFAADLLNKEGISEYLSALEDVKPQIAVLVNAAGYGYFGHFMDYDPEYQLDQININSRALTAMCYHSIPYMGSGSRIYNLASMSSWQPTPYMSVYGASKAYVLSFSRALGVELKSKGIKVMAITPGWIKTEFFDHAMHDNTINYFNRYYGPEQVIAKAIKDMKKGKTVSILGLPEKIQVLLVKLFPASFVMKVWCKQQGQ